jgi:transcriptional regulator with XRE-family HTH domain
MLVTDAKKLVVKFTQNEESKRFLKVLDELIHLQLVKNDSEFCRREGYSPQSLSQIRRGKRDVTIDLISKMFKDYLGNPIFIFGGEGVLLLNNATAPVVGDGELSYSNRFEEKKLARQVEKLTSILESYAKQAEMNVNYTKLLEDQIAELRKKNQP